MCLGIEINFIFVLLEQIYITNLYHQPKYVARLVINALDAEAGEGSEFAGRPSLPTPGRWRNETVIGQRAFLITLPSEKDILEEPSPPASTDLMGVLIAKEGSSAIALPPKALPIRFAARLSYSSITFHFCRPKKAGIMPALGFQWCGQQDSSLHGVNQ